MQVTAMRAIDRASNEVKRGDFKEAGGGQRVGASTAKQRAGGQGCADDWGGSSNDKKVSKHVRQGGRGVQMTAITAIARGRGGARGDG